LASFVLAKFFCQNFLLSVVARRIPEKPVAREQPDGTLAAAMADVNNSLVLNMFPPVMTRNFTGLVLLS
jgi:hypothetical protein